MCTSQNVSGGATTQDWMKGAEGMKINVIDTAPYMLTDTINLSIPLQPAPREPGAGKGYIVEVSADFDAPLESH
jgi:hypothetical protein